MVILKSNPIVIVFVHVIDHPKNRNPLWPGKTRSIGVRVIIFICNLDKCGMVVGEHSDRRFLLPVIVLVLICFTGNYLFLSTDNKNAGSLGVLVRNYCAVLLCLGGSVVGFSRLGSRRGEISRGRGENRDRNRGKHHLCEEWFSDLGRRMVAKNGTPHLFLDGLSRFFVGRFMFC